MPYLKSIEGTDKLISEPISIQDMNNSPLNLKLREVQQTPEALEKRGSDKMRNTFHAGMHPNNSKIRHGNYFVGVPYPHENPHNVNVIYPHSFPNRTGINFIENNKQYD